jgi:cyclopropane fatty-acyl-phospholipid synthase-like methyltransferase
LAEAGAVAGRVLDVGCGTGEHTIWATQVTGVAATGIDTSAAALAQARAKAERRGVDCRFEVADALALGQLVGLFDTVLDCGFFHLCADEDRDRYVDGLAAAMRPGARYYVLCFSDRFGGVLGPRRVSEAELRATFEAGFDLEWVREAVIEVLQAPDGIPAWLAAVRRA